MKILGFFSFLMITFIFMIIEGKHLSKENDDDFELSDINARSFLKNYDENNIDKFINNPDCVLCKFNLIPCCKPNICIKKRYSLDECLELKPR